MPMVLSTPHQTSSGRRFLVQIRYGPARGSRDERIWIGRSYSNYDKKHGFNRDLDEENV